MAELILDLFGDPIPEGWGKRGRPQHVPTDRNRNKVMVLLAAGWAPARIAGALGITGPTLRKHYFFELRQAASMRDRLKALHLQSLVEETKKGNVAAAKELGRLLDRWDAAEFGIGASRDEDEAPDPPRRRALGKKEEAAIAAQTAGAGSEWGDDLLAPRPTEIN